MPAMLLPIAALTAITLPEPVHALHLDCTPSQPGVRVNVFGLRDRSGRLKLEVYPATEADFLQDDETLLKAGKVFRRVVAAVPAQAMSLCVPVPGPGRYAVVVIHKRDNSPRFSVVSDGVAFSGNSRIGRRRPTVDEATVVVGERVTAVDVRMQYLRGLAGFKPLTR